MANIWFVSDRHLNHSNLVLKFKDTEGNPARPNPVTNTWFTSVEEHNEMMIEEHNKLVKPQDKVYDLGDFAFGPKSLHNGFAHRFNGHHRLIPGNHDDIEHLMSFGFYEKVEIWRLFKEHGFTCTHIPIHHEQFRHNSIVNVHGHVHQNSVDDPRWINICLEKTNMRPIHLDEIKLEIKNRGL